MSEPKRVGPELTVKKSCDGCRYEQSEHFAVQSDSGWHVYCAHPVHGEQRKRVSAYSWDTPEWCPITPGDPREALEEHAPLVALAGAVDRWCAALPHTAEESDALDDVLECRGHPLVQRALKSAGTEGGGT